LERVPVIETFNADLAAAGIAKQDARGCWADFHGLRYSFCTWMSQRYPQQVEQRLMRHCTITLTMDLYNDLDLNDTAEEQWTLGMLFPRTPPAGSPACYLPGPKREEGLAG
jgi:integrase